MCYNLHNDKTKEAGAENTESVKTKRLVIAPMTVGEMTALINKFKDTVPELSLAYREMRDSCVRFPGQHVWFAAWRICLADGGQEVGSAGFKGFNGGKPEIGYGISDEYAGNGYATEAVKALCGWALKMPGVVAIEAETDYNNLLSKRVLMKSGFVETGAFGEEGPRYVLKP